MYAPIRNYCDTLIRDFNSIAPERRALLERVADYVKQKIVGNKTAQLLYVCTHNSRRSHFGQVWSKVASAYYGIRNVQTFSGGTEATAFNTNAINALKRTGFEISAASSDKNPLVHVRYAANEAPVQCFSKVYDDAANPKGNFAAIMTCSEAEQNCPSIQGADLRIGLTYEDPKAFDGTPQQDEKYDERCRQIALESLYIFSKVKAT